MASTDFYTPHASETDLADPDTCGESEALEDAEAASIDTLYVPDEHGILRALTPGQRQMRQQLAQAGCLFDSDSHETSRKFIQGQLAQATGAALEPALGLLNPHYQLPGPSHTSSPLASPRAAQRCVPPLPPGPAPSLSRRPAHLTPHQVSEVGPKGDLPDREPDLHDLNHTLPYNKLLPAIARRLKRDAKDLYNSCKVRLGLDHPQT